MMDRLHYCVVFTESAGLCLIVTIWWRLLRIVWNRLHLDGIYGIVELCMDFTICWDSSRFMGFNSTESRGIGCICKEYVDRDQLQGMHAFRTFCRNRQDRDQLHTRHSQPENDSLTYARSISYLRR